MKNSGRLAIDGGKPVRAKPFPRYNTIGDEEKKAVEKVIESGVLSAFIGRHDTKFFGGPEVQALEREWCKKFHVKHAVTFNSATSALYAAMGAIGILPGDEVIVSAFSMGCSATAPLLYSGIPVFADLEKEYFCFDVDDVKKKITDKTKAILPVDLFGQPSDYEELNEAAEKHGLKVVTDAAHPVGAKYKGRFAGTLTDIGIFSLNNFKIIQSGEGGVAVTNDDDLALRMQLIRNHAETVVREMQYKNLRNLIGFNYRMTELEAAVAREQLKKLDSLLKERQKLAEYLTRRLSQIPGLRPPPVRPQCTHTYYLFPILFDKNVCKISRGEFMKRIQAEGIPLYRMAEGYVKPLHLEPIFAEKDKLQNGHPFNLCKHPQLVNYKHGMLPVVESLHEKEIIVSGLHYPPMTTKDMDDIADAFEKVLRLIR